MPARSRQLRVADDHWLSPVRRLPSPNADMRPPGAEVELLVLHNISLPPGEFGSGLVEALFCNRLDCSADERLADLEDLRVSAHLFISRRGRLTQFVPFDQRAWHAGQSSWFDRPGCNDYSVGIELEGTDDRVYTRSQYGTLLKVVAALFNRYRRLHAGAIVGHLELAPGRKTDPGAAFGWDAFLYDCVQLTRHRNDMSPLET
ncbi:MAG: 1,6-anhydro-N-acetylmuramyl-L-alanine amidase AmpD [Pseudomonadota bacterium]